MRIRVMIRASFRVSFLCGLVPVVALPAPDPVAECRASHSSDPPAHIECLEAALRDRNGQSVDEVNKQVPVAAPVKPPTVMGAEPAAVTAPVIVESPIEPPPPSGMGTEQVRAAEEEIDAQDQELSLHIISTSYSSRGLGTFRTEEGQIWRETTPSPERRRLKPDRQYTARIVRSTFGGYRMHVDGVRWMKTVERIE